MLNIVPFLLYSLSILLLGTNLMILGIILSSIFNATTTVFRVLPKELIFSFSAINKGASSNGQAKLLEYLSSIFSTIMGGLFLDNLPNYIPIIIACVTYIIAITPLFIYYLKHKQEKTFNKEATSNAVESFKEIKINKHQQEVLSKTLLFRYAFIYFVFGVLDGLTNVFSLYLFKVNAESYSYCAYIKASFNACFGLGAYIAGKLDDKIDITNLVIIFSVCTGVLVCIIPFFMNLIILQIFIFALIGFMYSFISIFIYSRMMMRCKIMGVGNKALLNRTQSTRFSLIFIYAICAISPIMFIPSFFVMGIMFGTCSFIIPKNEESTRQMLVDFLQNNKLY